MNEEVLFKNKAYWWFLHSEWAQILTLAACLFVIPAIPASIVKVVFDSETAEMIVYAVGLAFSFTMTYADGGLSSHLNALKKELAAYDQGKLPPNARFILRDPALQMQMATRFPEFNEELQRACKSDFFDTDDDIWLDFEDKGLYFHVKINKDAICWFKE